MKGIDVVSRRSLVVKGALQGESLSFDPESQDEVQDRRAE
jgi:hypothetical protein